MKPKIRYDHLASVYHLGSEIQTRIGDGWQYQGASVKETADGEGKYLLAIWRRKAQPPIVVPRQP